jgi:DNA-binding NarL/FixJ family response regulator
VLTRILIADDHESVIRTVRTLLEANPDWKVCGEAVDGREAVAKALELRPDIILLDLAMPTLNGLSAAHEISEALPDVPIILHTLYRYPQVDAEAQKHGIRRVVKKDSPGALVSVIQELVSARVQGTEAVSHVAEISPAALADHPTPATPVTRLSAFEASAPETTPSNVTPAPDNVIKAG